MADLAGLSAAQKELLRRFREARGFWDPLWDPVLNEAPEVLDAYLTLSSVPWDRGALPPLEKELIYASMDAATTHLYTVGTRIHLRNAIALGATRRQVLGVILLLTELGVVTMRELLPVLAEEAGLPEQSAEEHDPAFFRAFDLYRTVVRETGGLGPRLTSLIELAYTASATHLHASSARRYMRAALAAGATHDEVMEVLELVSMVGIHALTEGMPVLQELFPD